LGAYSVAFLCQVEVKRTVPREDMEVKGVTRTKKIFVGGIPPSLTEGNVAQFSY
jgi:heterogeneous nuclear ribonucleoprotein A1/A3